MDNYAFCLHTFEDIKARLASPSEYNYISMSSLIRKLLFDKNRILALAEKQVGKKFTFYVKGDLLEENYYRDFPALKFLFAGKLSNFPEPRELSMDEYGKVRVMYASQKCFTIKDIIKYVANKRGGVHLDEGELDENQKIIDAWSRSMGVNGTESVFEQIRYIGENIIVSSEQCGFVQA